MFETAVVNEPSVFEPLKFFYTMTSLVPTMKLFLDIPDFDSHGRNIVTLPVTGHSFFYFPSDTLTWRVCYNKQMIF